MKFWEGNFAIWGAFDRESKVRKMNFYPHPLPPPSPGKNDRGKNFIEIGRGSTLPTQFSTLIPNLQTASLYDAWFRSYSRKTVFQSQNPFFTQKNDWGWIFVKVGRGYTFSISHLIRLSFHHWLQICNRFLSAMVSFQNDGENSKFEHYSASSM